MVIRMYSNWLISEIEELERIGVICSLKENDRSLYLIIPRDLCKDNIVENIERLKMAGIRVFTKIKGINEYYNMHGDKLDRKVSLSNTEISHYAYEFIKDSKAVGEIKAATKLFENVTREELKDIQESIALLKLLEVKH